MISKVDIVICHCPCFDGMASYWVVKKWCDMKRMPYPYMRGVSPGLEEYDFPDLEGKSVVIADICFNIRIMNEIRSKVKELVVLDHHKTSEEIMKSHPSYIYDENRSGCQLCWDYFFPRERRPRWLDLIGDRDLWKFRFSETRPFSSAIFHRYSNSRIKDIDAISRASIKELVQFGMICLEIDQKTIDIEVRKAKKCILTHPESGKSFVVWASTSTRSRSEIGHILSTRSDCDFALIYSYSLEDDEWWFSLRSQSEARANVGEIAKMFPEGGGHSCASGFTWRGHIREILKVVEEE
jgi:uncharacterized protein